MSYNNKIKSSFQKLLEDYKSTPICQHLGLALGSYNSIEFVDNKTLAQSLQSYIEQLDFQESMKYQDVEDEFNTTEEF